MTSRREEARGRRSAKQADALRSSAARSLLPPSLLTELGPRPHPPATLTFAEGSPVAALLVLWGDGDDRGGGAAAGGGEVEARRCGVVTAAAVEVTRPTADQHRSSPPEAACCSAAGAATRGRAWRPSRGELHRYACMYALVVVGSTDRVHGQRRADTGLDLGFLKENALCPTRATRELTQSESGAAPRRL